MNAFNTSFGVNQQSASLGSYGSLEKKKEANDYKKIFCAYHNTEFLTNFCIEKQCLMPLCPTCVVQHTEQHYQCQQKPTYVNLQEALNETKQKCYSSIIKLQEFNRKNEQLSNYILGLSEYVRKQLGECRQKVFREIQSLFQAYEGKLIEQIKNKYAEDGVYNRKECDQVREYIQSQTELLYDKISQLKGEQCLAALIRYYENDQKNLEDQINQVSNYIERNRKAGGLFIQNNAQQVTKCLDGLCQKIIKIQYLQQSQFQSFNSTRNNENSSSKKGKLVSSLINRESSAGNIGVFGSNQKGSRNYGSNLKPKESDRNFYYSPI